MRTKLFLAAVMLTVMAATPSVACEPNCNIPTVSKTTIPVWHVVKCVVGPQGGPYTDIACDDPGAVHPSPFNKDSVCFLGSDNKIHWDYPREVDEGRRFINRRLTGGRWVVDWQDPLPQK